MSDKACKIQRVKANSHRHTRQDKTVSSAYRPPPLRRSPGDYETVCIPPVMSRKTLGILDGGRGGGVDRSWRRQGIKGVDKGGA